MNSVLRFVFVALIFSQIPIVEAKVRGKFTESEWDSEFKAQRIAAFGPWMSSANVGETLVKAEIDGFELLMLDYDSSGRFRAALRKPAGRRNADNSYHLWLSKDGVLEQQVLMDKQGYRLIHLMENERRDSYNAVWIHKRGYQQAVDTLAKLGVTPPTIEITGGVEAPVEEEVNLPAVDLTTGSRVWTATSGNKLEASLQKVDGATATFKRANGATFNYQISGLSDRDQIYIRELVNARTKEAAAAADAPKLTDWFDVEDFDARYADEKAKGNFGAFIEFDRRDKVRAIFAKRPRGMGWYYQTKSSRSGFLDYDRTYTSKGFKLLTSSFEKRNDWHTSVWVRTNEYPALIDMLKKAGVNHAEIDGGAITFSEVKD